MALTDSRRGTWIINANATKPLLRYGSTDPGLTRLDHTLFAGKCGSLLIKLSADEVDQLTKIKVTAQARLCGIGLAELPVSLETLKAQGCVD
jgi:hypothetical protein